MTPTQHQLLAEEKEVTFYRLEKCDPYELAELCDHLASSKNVNNCDRKNDIFLRVEEDLIAETKKDHPPIDPLPF